jgi:CRISPR/Cas system-associated exonuclease Cas4 (RecB family)
MIRDCKYYEIGDKGCKNFKNGYCDLPHIFKCSLINRPTQLVGRTYSYSKITSYEKCPRKYYLEYVLNVRPPEEDRRSALLGQLFSEIRAKIDSGLKWDISNLIEAEQDQEMKLELMKLQKVMKFYEAEKLVPVTKEENQEYYIELPELNIKGYADMVIGNTLYEYKYTSQVDLYNRISMSRQISIYLMGLPQVKEITIIAVKKPMVRLGKKDKSLQDVIDRIDGLEYKKISFLRSEFDLEYEMKSLKKVIERIESDKDFYPNTQNCNVCSWFEYCDRHPYMGRCGFDDCKYKYVEDMEEGKKGNGNQEYKSKESEEIGSSDDINIF